jgi:hypothetical protein
MLATVAHMQKIVAISLQHILLWDIALWSLQQRKDNLNICLYWFGRTDHDIKGILSYQIYVISQEDKGQSVGRPV